jgi:hypothetical protein
MDEVYAVPGPCATRLDRRNVLSLSGRSERKDQQQDERELQQEASVHGATSKASDVKSEIV